MNSLCVITLGGAINSHARIRRLYSRFKSHDAERARVRPAMRFHCADCP
jgi:hypothetical protein